ncbi:hypothetical protein ACIBEJ_47385 [Nonomuraea sp. NPDC050790]|uniref:hypothetical protein n=1 Tax=Nonomuraea sp. NPDC050790 TaxID=3364371 RepID=UPI0037A78EF4
MKTVPKAKKSHSKLGPVFKDIGRKLAKVSTKKKSVLLATSKDYKAGKVDSLLSEVANKKMSSAKFGTAYRGIQPEQDELVSTATVRDLMTGATSSGSLSAAKRKELEHAFELMSKLRFPTRWTGFATKTQVMQHPTAVGTGLFGESKSTMSLHNQLDLSRRNEVAEAMTAESKASGTTAERIALAGMRRAIEFSLNEFIAPATAADVKPRATLSKKSLIEQVRAREGVKKILVDVGGSQESGPVNLSRTWATRKGKRSASPPRM